jgi:RND superfamily putative drug exporter
MLWFSTFAKIQYTGPSIALSLGVALAAALTLAPVLLHWLRGAVFWPFPTPHHVKGADIDAETQAESPMHGSWVRISDRVVRYPAAILIVSLLGLTPLAVVGARSVSNYGQLTDLSPDQPSLVGARLIRKYFNLGELGPTTVLIHHPRLDFLTAEGRAAIDRLSRDLAALPDVAEVRSVSQPLGKPPAPPRTFVERLQQAALEPVIRPKADVHYVGTAAAGADRDHITRLIAVFKTDPFSEESLQTLEGVRGVIARATAPQGPLADASTGLAGATASINDLKRVITQDERRMYVLVTLGVYAVLVVLLRRPGICLYLMATVILGYLASLGVTELVFHALHTGPEPWVGLDWKVGFFLFVILVAVGEDYNIFLMSRVIEEERKHGTVEGTRRAVAYTGGIISSCGLIMAGTFGSMLTGRLTALRELGFALGLGVLLDTFVVRPILVPAFVVLLHRARTAWWTSKPTPTPLGQAEEATTTSAT